MRKLAWKVRNNLIEGLANWGDRFLYKMHLCWLNDRTWSEPFAKYLEWDARGGGTATRILDRRFTLYEYAKSVRRLPGCTAECGVLFGTGSGMICKTLEGTYGPDEYHYGFDSFEGLPEPTEADRMKNGHQWWAKGRLCVGYERVQENLSDLPKVRLVQGWIPDSLAPYQNCSFRMVHIDLDLHQATIDSLHWFYPRMVRGGVFLFDDYGLQSCPGARSAVLEFFRDKPDAVIELVSGQAVVIKW